MLVLQDTRLGSLWRFSSSSVSVGTDQQQLPQSVNTEAMHQMMLMGFEERLVRRTHFFTGSSHQ